MRKIRTGSLAFAVCALLVSLGITPPANAVEVVTPYPAVRVEAGQTATFDLRVTSTIRESVRLRARGVPQGWNATFRGGGREIDAVYARSSGARQTQLEVRVPGDAAPRRYQMTAVASASTGTSTLPLELRVAKQAPDAFALSTEFPTLQRTDSDTFRFDLELTNRTVQRARFSLSASGPQGWNVSASPARPRGTGHAAPGPEPARRLAAGDRTRCRERRDVHVRLRGVPASGGPGVGPASGGHGVAPTPGGPGVAPSRSASSSAAPYSAFSRLCPAGASGV